MPERSPVSTSRSSDSLRDHFLLAMPGLSAGIFSHSITYICEHGESGAMGIIINQPLDLSVQEIFEHLQIKPQGDFSKEAVLAGGPVPTRTPPPSYVPAPTAPPSPSDRPAPGLPDPGPSEGPPDDLAPPPVLDPADETAQLLQPSPGQPGPGSTGTRGRYGPVSSSLSPASMRY